MDKSTGIVGVFNCQRAGKWPPTPGTRYEPPAENETVLMSGLVSPLDVDSLEETADQSWKGDCAVLYIHFRS